MPASPNDPRTKRRKAAGDDVNKISMAPQPVPGAPQGAGNMMNYPMQQNSMGEIGQQIGAGSYQFPYGDLGEGVGLRSSLHLFNLIQIHLSLLFLVQA